MRIGQNDNLMAINIRQGSNQCIITEYITMVRNKNMISNILEHLRLWKNKCYLKIVTFQLHELFFTK